jgi:hypothetical protein
MRDRRVTLRAFSTLTVIVCATEAVRAGEACVRRYMPGATSGGALMLRLSGGVDAEIVQAALAMWGTCATYGAGFPQFSLDRGPERELWVRLVAASGRSVCGELRGNEIRLYAFAQQPDGSVRRCNSFAGTLAHELGHVLGLLDAPDEALCSSHIMARLPATGGDRRAVQLGECNAVDARWRTATEVRPLDVRGVVAAAC